MNQNTFLDTLGQDQLVALFRDALHNHGTLEPARRQALNATVRDFLAGNLAPLGALLRNPAFVDVHVGLTRELLERAHTLAPDPGAKAWVEGQAEIAGFEDLFAVPPVTTTTLTRSQARALEQLRALATLHFRGAEHYGVRLRTTPLLIGPSGVGKSHLIDRLGQGLQLEVMRLTVGDWIVAGARSETPTLKMIHARLQSGGRFVLQVDELDKFGGNRDAWSQAQLTEIFNVLDRKAAGGGWTEADRAKLRQNVFMVGSGTWQEVWRERGARAVGFNGESGGGFDLAGKVRRAQVIPAELLNRFNSEWLVLEPLGVADFERLARELKLGPAILDPVAAAAEGLNYRAVENALTAAALKAITRELRESSR